MTTVKCVCCSVGRLARLVFIDNLKRTQFGVKPIDSSETKFKRITGCHLPALEIARPLRDFWKIFFIHS